MANNVVIGDVWEAKAFCSAQSQTGLNVLHYQCTAQTGTGGTDLQLSTALDASFAPVYKPAIAATATYYGVRVQRIFPLPKTLSILSAANTGIGTGGPATLPGQVSGVITFYTNLAGRAYRGRAYIPFPASAVNDGTLDRPIAAYQTALNALGTQLFGGFTIGSGANTSTMAMVIWHKRTNSSTLVASYRSNLKWGTQRRRGNYGQLNPYPPT